MGVHASGVELREHGAERRQAAIDVQPVALVARSRARRRRRRRCERGLDRAARDLELDELNQPEAVNERSAAYRRR